MDRNSRYLLCCLFLMLALSSPAKDLEFAGYSWTVRSGKGGPGPNVWDENNVWVDAATNLHLKISQRDGKWSCAEVTMQKRLGFGKYQFQVISRLDQFDDNVVLGLFNYPTREVGSDGTHEIDIEFARWGNEKNPIGNYTVWPAEKWLKQISKSFPFTLASDQTTHRFIWNREGVKFRSWQGHLDDQGVELANWICSPKEPERHISQNPMPIHLNLWLFQGRVPKNGREVEVIIRQFQFTPE